MMRRSKYTKKSAFTMLELIFVIVIIGVLGKFGIDMMAKAYQNYIFTKIANKLQNQSAMAVEFIGKRLSYRIPDSVIGKVTAGNYDGIQGLSTAKNYRILEWVAMDIDGWRGESQPYWSGIADLLHVNTGSTSIITPETNVSAINSLVDVLSQGDSDINDTAVYFIGSNSDAQTSYGWQGGVTLSGTGAAMHPVSSTLNNRLDGNFSSVDMYEYYKLAWTANAIALENYDSTSETYDLAFYYDYQPWLGERYNDATSKRSVIMQNVSTFQFRAVGSMLKVQVCVKSDLTSGAHAICKEKTVF
jgi:prepilin-type N-terminal cleavage/methylation domain-containing protein